MLVIPAHDFAEDDTERVRRRLIIARKPAPTRSRIDAGEVREVEFGFVRPRKSREIGEGNAMTVDAADISVRPFGLFSFR